MNRNESAPRVSRRGLFAGTIAGLSAIGLGALESAMSGSTPGTAAARRPTVSPSPRPPEGTHRSATPSADKPRVAAVAESTATVTPTPESTPVQTVNTLTFTNSSKNQVQWKINDTTLQAYPNPPDANMNVGTVEDTVNGSFDQADTTQPNASLYTNILNNNKFISIAGYGLAVNVPIDDFMFGSQTLNPDGSRTAAMEIGSNVSHPNTTLDFNNRKLYYKGLPILSNMSREQVEYFTDPNTGQKSRRMIVDYCPDTSQNGTYSIACDTNFNPTTDTFVFLGNLATVTPTVTDTATSSPTPDATATPIPDATASSTATATSKATATLPPSPTVTVKPTVTIDPPPPDTDTPTPAKKYQISLPNVQNPTLPTVAAGGFLTQVGRTFKFIDNVHTLFQRIKAQNKEENTLNKHQDQPQEEVKIAA